MKNPVPMAEIWRGPILESVHLGHAVVCDDSGQIVRAWGEPDEVILPRSSCKMIQALPLLTSGAADKYGLTNEQLALACASHNGARIHTQRVGAWLDQLGLSEPDLRCGAHAPYDEATHHAMIRADETPCQIHNNCSGKHAGFLTLGAHMQAGPEYAEVDHPVQQACLSAFEEVTGVTSQGFAIDGCSAPNFATTVHGLARAMAWFASAGDRSDRASVSGQRLVESMTTYPELVAGEGRACTLLMRATDGKAAIKTGAEAVFTAILPEKRLGVALKIADGATRASECAIAAILCELGVLDAEHPATQQFMNAPILSRRGLHAGWIRPASGLT